MKYIDKFLNGITMYKLVLYGLLSLSVLTIAFSLFGVLSYNPLNLLYSLVALVLVCYLSNTLFAYVFKVPANSESYFITALILYLILFPINTISELGLIALTGVIAMASKYILVIKKKHIFNPAAVGLISTSIAAWWVGSTVMFVPVLILGFLILRKLNKFQIFFVFASAAIVSSIIFALVNGTEVLSTLRGLILSGPLLFLGTVMFTEPLTMPPQKRMQIIYGIIVGGLFGSQFSFGPIYSTPALALIIGNIFSYIVSPRIRLVLTLMEKRLLTADVWEFVWRLDRKISFKAGQYLEWTLGHKKVDIRGNRRFFTIASSPTESSLLLGIKSYENSSSFKKKLLSMNPGETIVASQLAGEFTLPEDKLKKIIFIAGGIGVTPFRSMVKEMTDSGDKRNVTLFFSNRTPKDVVYKDIFEGGKESFGLKTIYAVNDLAGETLKDDMRVGFINAEMIMKEAPDYKDSIYYISGPHGMVTAFEDALSKVGVKKSHIKTDFFPGYV